MIDFNRFVNRYEQVNAALPLSESPAEHRLNGLSVRFYAPNAAVDEVLIICHGGGVNADAGYDIPARQISHALPICVCLMDIRGHGRSAGRRGDAANPAHIWRDVDTVIGDARTRFPEARIHLLGHSSGGGMLINYFSQHAPSQAADSLILLAPALGPFSPPTLNRPFSVPFAAVNRWPFIINAVSAGLLCGHRTGVTLNFPRDVLEARPDFVQHYSVNMARALTPRDPARQLRAISLPVTVLLAEQDELFDACQMAAFFRRCGNPHIRCQTVPGTHLDCLFGLTAIIGEHVAGLAPAG